MQRQLTTDEGDDAGSWWSRRCGGREVLLLALPLMISTMTWSISHFTDRMFLLWYSPVAMAAAMPAGMAHFAMLCLPLGIASYVNTFVAQYLGANRPERVGLAVFAGGRVALLFTPLFLLSIWIAPALFGATGHEPDVVVAEVLYFQILAFGAGPTILAAAFSAFFTGQGRMYTVMWVDGSSSLVNIILNYIFIFGYLGFPEGGIEG
ncbi:MAG: MATE family efflux transporter, partial [Pirellulales bacterium]